MIIASSISKERVISISLGISILFLSAQIQIPLRPVPITLQPVAVMLLGLLFSSRDALSSSLLYISLGVLGLPMFAGYNRGFYYLLGPTGGYLFGFVLASFFMAYLREKINKDSFVYTVFYCIIGNIFLYLSGVSWLMILMHISIMEAVSIGILPFIIPGCIKILILSGFLNLIRKR